MSNRDVYNFFVFYRNIRLPLKILYNPAQTYKQLFHNKLYTGDDFDWIIGSGGTPSAYTGPNYDHTFKNKSGHFAYVESTKLNLLGSKAWLVSEQ